jgi:catechol 2,3-dioxygenase-like lactoylglutathione lyase family enzyme
MSERPAILGLRHVALVIDDAAFDRTVHFWCEALGMRVDWQPDADNVYLTSGTDNVALHRAKPPRVVDHSRSALDHVGVCVPTAADVHAWHERLAPMATALGIAIVQAPKTHRDGATSFYLRDPAGTTVQIIHLPAPSAPQATR